MDEDWPPRRQQCGDTEPHRRHMERRSLTGHPWDMTRLTSCPGVEEKGENMTTFRKGQKVRVSFDTVVTSEVPDTLYGWLTVRVDAVMPERHSLRVPVEFIEPIDDPASDPVGTVRRWGGAHTPLTMVRMAHPHREFDDLYWCAIDGPTANSWNGDVVMVGSEIIGAVPGTPAAEVYGSGE